MHTKLLRRIYNYPVERASQCKYKYFFQVKEELHRYGIKADDECLTVVRKIQLMTLFLTVNL